MYGEKEIPKDPSVTNSHEEETQKDCKQKCKWNRIKSKSLRPDRKRNEKSCVHSVLCMLLDSVNIQ